MRPQRGGSWTLDSRPAARFNSRPNVSFWRIILAEVRVWFVSFRKFGRKLTNMPAITEVDYSPALKDAERALLGGIESNIAKAVWNAHQHQKVYWTAWRDGNDRTIYVLVNWHQRTDVIVYFSETEVRKLTESAACIASAENEIAFGSRRQILSGFAERPEPHP